MPSDPKIRRRIPNAVKVTAAVVLSAVILLLIVYWVGFRETMQALENVGPIAFLVLGVLAFLPLAVQAVAWWVLNDTVDHRIPFFTLYEATTMGMAVNILTPSSYLGGEPVKVYYVGKRTGLPYPEVAGTVVLAKWLEALSFLLVFTGAAGVSIYAYGTSLFAGDNLPLGLALLGLIAVLGGSCGILALALWRGWRPLTVIVGWIARLRPASRFLRNLRVKTGSMEAQVTRVFNENPKRSTSAFTIFLGEHFVLFIRPWVFFALGVGLGLDFGALCLIFVMSQALSALQFTPSGAGTLDVGMLAVFAQIELLRPDCMAFLLCIRFWDAVIVGCGALIAARIGSRLLSGVVPTEDDADAPAADDAEPGEVPPGPNANI